MTHDYDNYYYVDVYKVFRARRVQKNQIQILFFSKTLLRDNSPTLLRVRHDDYCNSYYKFWNELINEEWFLQGEKEKQRGLSPLPHMDRAANFRKRFVTQVCLIDRYNN